MKNQIKFYGSSKNPYVLSQEKGEQYKVSYFKGDKATSKNFNSSEKANIFIKSNIKTYK